MKKRIIYIAVVVITFGLWSCHNHKHNNDHDHDHDHAHEQEHSHDHSGHDHDDHDHDHGITRDTEAVGNDHASGEIVFTPEQAKETGLEVETVRPASFHQVIKTSGEILSAQGDEKTIAATVSGIVSFNKASLGAGTKVGAGETVISISSRHIGEGDPSQKAISAYNIAKQDFERAESLIQDKLISQNEYNTIRLNYENARITYEALGRNQTKQGTGITSPMNGFVKNRLVTEGEYVEVGQPLLTVSQNRRLQLQADVSERYYNDLPHIVSANFRSPYDEQVHKLSDLNGKLTSFGKSASGQEYYIPVNFEFDNAGRIVPGSYVEVYLLSATRENAITVLLSALVEEQGIYSVYLQLDDVHYKKQEVKTGQNDGERVEILAGLKAGDKVVGKGAYHVKLASASAAIPHAHEH